MSQREIVPSNPVRTAIAGRGGSLKSVEVTFYPATNAFCKTATS